MSQTEILSPVAPEMSTVTTGTVDLVKKNDVMNRIAITKLNISGCYTLKNGVATDDACQLCKQQLTAPSLENMQKGNLLVQISIGNCGHCFHKTCIESHLTKNMSCPIDKTPWTTSNNYIFPNVDTNNIGNMTLVTGSQPQNTNTNTINGIIRESSANDKKETKSSSSFDNKVKILNNLI